MIIYLHGMGENPLESEKESIRALKSVADGKGYQLYSPLAAGTCYYLAPKYHSLKCWDHQNIEAEIERLLSPFRPLESWEVIIIGYSNGAYLLAGAHQRNLLEGVKKVGIISGGAIGSLKPKASMKAPVIYIENATQDVTNSKWSFEFKTLLSDNSAVETRDVDRSHHLNAEEMKSFVSWLLE
jgi:predicted esterase